MLVCKILYCAKQECRKWYRQKRLNKKYTSVDVRVYEGVREINYVYPYGVAKMSISEIETY